MSSKPVQSNEGKDGPSRPRDYPDSEHVDTVAQTAVHTAEPLGELELLHNRLNTETERRKQADQQLHDARSVIEKYVSELSDARGTVSEMMEAIKQRTAEIVETRDVTVFALAKLSESRDPETGAHLERMRAYAQILGEHLAAEGPYADQIDEQYLQDLYRSSPLHDIGKVGIPDAILLKPGRLSAAEFDAMKAHALIGSEALEMVTRRGKSAGFLAMAVDITKGHHERFDGSGYPAGLSGQDIPLASRIVCLADVYDALTSVRVYRAALAPEVSRTMIEGERGKHFDPAIVDAFLARWEDFQNVGALLDSREP